MKRKNKKGNETKLKERKGNERKQGADKETGKKKGISFSRPQLSHLHTRPDS